MWEMALVFEKRLKYGGNDVDLLEIAKICGKWLLVFDKRLKLWRNDLEIWKIAKIFGKWFRYMGHSFSI